jgi:hypothetical protein
MCALLENSYFQNIISATIGGIIVYFFQFLFDNKKKKKENIKNSIVGSKELKILSQNFLYQYEPHKISIDKIIEEFGNPFRIIENNSSLFRYIFEFKNAKLDVCENLSTKDIISLTVFSKLDKDFPLDCRLSFEEDNEILGKAEISDVIIKDSFLFNVINTQLGYETIIGCNNSYRQTKHLKYFYQINGKYDSIDETKGQIIRQVCVTQNESIHPFFSFMDTFYE